MAFYSQDPALGNLLQANLQDLAQGRPGLDEQLSVTWLAYASSPWTRRLASTKGIFGVCPWPGLAMGGIGPAIRPAW